LTNRNIIIKIDTLHIQLQHHKDTSSPKHKKERKENISYCRSTISYSRIIRRHCHDDSQKALLYGDSVLHIKKATFIKAAYLYLKCIVFSD